MFTRRLLLLAPAAYGQERRWADVFDFARQSAANGGLLVLRQGRVVYERYYGLASEAATPNLASIGKAVTSACVGILMDKVPVAFRRGLDTLVTHAILPSAPESLSGALLGQLLAMTAGVRGNNPCYQNGKEVAITPAGPDGWEAMADEIALGHRPDSQGRTTATPWCAPGAGYSYATSSIHLASMILREVAGMQLQEFAGRYLAEPLEWGRWNFGYRNRPLKHTPGGGGICVNARGLAQFGEMLRLQGQGIVPASYVSACSKASPYNPHFGYSLQFDVNTHLRVPGAPRDAFWKTGSGGHALYVVPSLELTAVKLGGRDSQYSPNDTGLPLPEGAGDPNIKPSMPEREGAEGTLARLCA